MYAMFEKVVMPGTGEKFGTGWLPPLPDLRDYTAEHPQVVEMTKALGIAPTKKSSFKAPATADLRPWCTAIEDQGSLGSCTANAAVGVVEYFEQRAKGSHVEGSRLFVYKTTRNLMGVVGDTGSWLRTAMGALAHCGVAPEKYWPYTTRKESGPSGEPTFDDEPTSFVYALADNYEALRYFCHDPLGANKPADRVLKSVKRFLAAGIPSMFGFFGFPSFGAADVAGGIPYPCPGEQAVWGHAVVAVGYDDAIEIRNTTCGVETQGALLIRNSWGTTWGDMGYGWLPYKYVRDRMALDFWSLLRMGWLETKQFGI